MSDLVELLRGLVEIDSINPDLIPGAAGEAEIARYVAEWSERAGLEAVIEEAAPGRPNVIATARGSGGGRTLLLNAHMDTVGVDTMETPFDARVEDGRLYGRGSYDMKGSLAAILAVAAEAKKRGLRGDVVVAAVADEEVASIGTESLVASGRRFDAAVVAEPTELDVAIAHKGFAGFEIETRGRAAHGSRPDLGEDAIVRMGPVLVRLDELSARLLANQTHPLLGSGSIHASLIEGGQEFSSYPERCLLTGERRTLPGESLEDVERELGEIAGDWDAPARRLEAAVRGGRGRGDRPARARPRRDRADRRPFLDGRSARRRLRRPDGRLRPARRGRARRGRVGRPGLGRTLRRGAARGRRRLLWLAAERPR